MIDAQECGSEWWGGSCQKSISDRCLVNIIFDICCMDRQYMSIHMCINIFQLPLECAITMNRYMNESRPPTVRRENQNITVVFFYLVDNAKKKIIEKNIVFWQFFELYSKFSNRKRDKFKIFNSSGSITLILYSLKHCHAIAFYCYSTQSSKHRNGRDGKRERESEWVKIAGIR